MPQPDVIVVGGGLAGLCCARALAVAGVSPLVLEAADGVGGRVRTDSVDGFLLDRGFQVLLTAYPECRRVLDYAALELKSFYPGALVRFGGSFHKVPDPFRQPLDALANVFGPIGMLGDKATVLRLRADVRSASIVLFLGPAGVLATLVTLYVLSGPASHRLGLVRRRGSSPPAVVASDHQGL